MDQVKAYPNHFLEHLQHAPGFDEQAMTTVQGTLPPVSIRLNPAKRFPHHFHRQVPWCSQGYYLDTRPIFAHDPLFHAGAYYVQEASSMFLDHVLRTLQADVQPMRILDLCAAPGGKSTLIASVMHPQSVLVANEVIRSRTAVLHENITKWGDARVIVTHNDPADFATARHYFDIIVADAPCSGSGMFRKDPDAMQEWSIAHVAHCSKRQERILEDVLPALKPGGWLIYSTCSYSEEENEHIVDGLVQSGYHCFIDSTVSMRFPGIVLGKNGYRFYPYNISGEGFFIAAMQKPDGPASPIHQTGCHYDPCSNAEKENAAAWLNNPELYVCVKDKENLLAIPHSVYTVLQTCGKWHILQAGVRMGACKRNQFIPEHDLFMSAAWSKHLPLIELDAEAALQYLRKNTFTLPDTSPGWAAITYQQVVLGGIKVVPGRFNNYYPTAWRLRK